MLTLKDIQSQVNSKSWDVPNPADAGPLSFRRNGEQSFLFIEWPAVANGRELKVRISVMELIDFNGQGICDSAAIMAALRKHRQHLETRANAFWMEGTDEVLLDIGSLTAPID